MNEKPGHNAEFFNPAATEISQRIQRLFFTLTPEDYLNKEVYTANLDDPEIHEVDFSADKKDSLIDFPIDYLHVRMIKGHSENLGLIPPTFNLPAFCIPKKFALPFREYDSPLITKFGLLPTLIHDSNNNGFTIRNEYYLNLDGQAMRHEIIKLLTQTPKELTEEIEEALAIKRVNFPVSENDSRFAPYLQAMSNIYFVYWSYTKLEALRKKLGNKLKPFLYPPTSTLQMCRRGNWSNHRSAVPFGSF